MLAGEGTSCFERLGRFALPAGQEILIQIARSLLPEAASRRAFRILLRVEKRLRKNAHSFLILSEVQTPQVLRMGIGEALAPHRHQLQ